MLYFDSHLLQGETSPLFKAGGIVLTFGQRKTCHIVKKFGSFFSENGHGWANNSWYLNLGLGGVCEGCCAVGWSIVKTAGKVIESKPTKSQRTQALWSGSSKEGQMSWKCLTFQASFLLWRVESQQPGLPRSVSEARRRSWAISLWVCLLQQLLLSALLTLQALSELWPKQL